MLGRPETNVSNRIIKYPGSDVSHDRPRGHSGVVSKSLHLVDDDFLDSFSHEVSLQVESEPDHDHAGLGLVT